MAQDHADNKEKAPRTGRPAVRQPSSRRLASVKAKATAGIVVAVLALFGLAALVLGRSVSAVRELERSQYAGMATETRVRLDRLVSRDRTRMMDAAFADGLYALVAKGAAPPDSFIRPGFTERFAAQYGDRFVGLYDMTGARLFAWSDPSTAGLEPVAAANSLFRMFDNREPVVGLMRHGEKLYWVAGAPILPTNYTDQTQPIRGYLVVAQPFNPASIAPAAADRSGRLELLAFDPPKSPFRTRVVSAGVRDSVRVEFTLPDVFAQQNTLAALTTSRNEFLIVESKVLTSTIIAALGLIALAALGWYAVNRWLVTPTTKLADALAPIHHGQVPSLIGSVSSATEWSAVTNAVNRLIAVSRSGQDRFERLTAAGADALWDRDLATGEWTVNARFRELLGVRDGDGANPLAVLTERLHPDDAGPVLKWLAAPSPTPPQLGADVRIRRAGRDWLPARIEGSVGTDAAGVATRITGRIADRSDQQAARDAIGSAAASMAADRATTGRFLTSIARSLPTTAGPDLRGQLEAIGGGLTRSLGSAPAPFDLYPLLQALANATPGAELSVVPGVPERVTGDRTLLKGALERLIAATGPDARIAIRADQLDRQQPDSIRFTVESKSIDARAERLARIGAALATGESDGPDPLLDCRAAHHLAVAMGGSAGAVGEGYLVSRWIIVPLVAVPMAAETATDGPGDWNSGAEPAAFDVETTGAPPTTTAPRPSGAAPRVELVADATVTINFDDPIRETAPIGASFLAKLAAGDSAAEKAARIALADLPVRLSDLKGAAKAAEIRTASEITTAIARMAVAIEAKPLDLVCRDLIDATESQYLESVDEQVRVIDQAWIRTEAVLSAALPTAPVVAPSPDLDPPIDPTTLEQLTASLSDGGGLGGQLVSLFMAEAPTRVEAIERAAGAGDWAALRSSTGDLKGMCALIGAGPLAARCVAAGEASGPAAWTEALAIRGEWERVQRVLDGLLGARAGA